MVLKKRLAVRISAVRKIEANLALVIAGLLLLLLAPCWRFVVAPSLKVVPTDFDLFYKYPGTLTRYANPPGDPVIGPSPVEIPIVMERFLLSKPHLSTPGTSVVDIETTILESSGGETLYEYEELISIDRKTGELTKVDSNNGANGYLVVFPFNTPEKSIPVWFEPTGNSFKATFTESTVKSELPVFGFKLELSTIPVETPAGYPDEYTGAQLKETLSMPELGVENEELFQVSYKANASINFFIEPVMGTIVDVTDGEFDLLLNVEKPETSFRATKLISEMNFSKEQGSVIKAIAYARDELAKKSLQYTYIPLGFLVLGTIILLIGLFAGITVKNNSDDD
ncbi:MAG: DUF3068 domain-containing protein [Actinobacteria bacterium]|nr:DUF3068 domain-containing protein [Actinomycetota bacterium]